MLVLEGDRVALFVEPSDPEMELWAGRARTLDEWSEALAIPVRPLSELALRTTPACLPPQDEETAAWMSVLLRREVEAQSGPHLSGADVLLADQLVACRLSYDEAAQHQLAFAAETSAAAHRAGMRATRGATRETEVRGAMVGALIGAGLVPGYTPIVTTQGQILHAERSDGALNSGDLILCDVGGETREGFNADITRTWPVSGRFSPTQRDIYQGVLDVQKKAASGVGPGVNYADLHLAAVRNVAEFLRDLGVLRGGLDELVQSGAASVFFPHGLGHLLGLDVHDMEDLGDRAGYGENQERDAHPTLATLRLTRVLKAGMCVTIEPGFYQVPLLLERARADARVAQLIDWQRLGSFSDVRGIRIEDDVLVSDGGGIVLSDAAPKEIEHIEQMLEG